MDKATVDAALRNKQFLEAKLSDQLRMAVEDLTEMETTPGYIIDMNWWHNISHEDAMGNRTVKQVCAVCFAGAVLSRRFGVPWGDLHANALNKKVLNSRRKYVMLGLDALRRGELKEALAYMRIDKPDALPDQVDVINYRKSPATFKRDMLGVANLLEEHGL